MTLKRPRKIIAFGILGIVFLGSLYTLSTTDKLIVPMDKEGHYLARKDRSR